MKYENLRLRDQHVQPTRDVLQEALGESHGAYEAFQEGISGLDIENLWKYEACVTTRAWLARGEYKWTTIRGANKVKNVYWLSVWDGLFKVAIWFKEDNRAEILGSDVSEGTKQIIREGKMFGPKMRTFPVEFEVIDLDTIADIYTLLKHKIRLEAR